MIKEIISEINTALHDDKIDYRTAYKIVEVIGKEIGQQFDVIKNRVVFFDRQGGIPHMRDAFNSLL